MKVYQRNSEKVMTEFIDQNMRHTASKLLSGLASILISIYFI